MFQRLNTRAAKVNGEMVMWIRKRYAEMQSYPMIREGLHAQFGVVLSIQQITRIAKGHSFAQLPTLPTEREVDLTMHVNALRSQALPEPTDEQIARSLAKVQELVAKDNEPRPSVLEILEARDLSNGAGSASAPPTAQSPAQLRSVPTLEEIEHREREAMGLKEGAGLEKLFKTAAQVQVQQQPTAAEKLLEALKDERGNQV